MTVDHDHHHPRSNVHHRHQHQPRSHRFSTHETTLSASMTTVSAATRFPVSMNDRCSSQSSVSPCPISPKSDNERAAHNRMHSVASGLPATTTATTTTPTVLTNNRAEDSNDGQGNVSSHWLTPTMAQQQQLQFHHPQQPQRTWSYCRHSVDGDSGGDRVGSGVDSAAQSESTTFTAGATNGFYKFLVWFSGELIAKRRALAFRCPYCLRNQLQFVPYMGSSCEAEARAWRCPRPLSNEIAMPI